MSEKTEDPTPKREREAREEGQVAYSKDFTQTLLSLAFLLYLILAGAHIGDQLGAMMLAPAGLMSVPFPLAVDTLTARLLPAFLWILAPFLLIVLLVGTGACLVQVGLAFSPKALAPSGKRLDLVENAKKLFSKRSLMELLKAMVKIAIMASVVYVIVRQSLPQLIWLPGMDARHAAVAFCILMERLLIFTMPAYIAVGALDIVWQRLQHRKQLKMSKEEVTREHKEMEGDPHIKHKRKEIHKELSENPDVERSAFASALVVNPTHIAVALYYDAATVSLPIVWAKGSGAVAEQMIAVARQAGVPVMRNVPLAWSLYERVEREQYIPGDLVTMVAEVLRAIQQLKREPT